ncbi:transcriptional regulator with XRE-family HTH domain [Actinokineospora baliensis]|uniref:XRE family transcriptional regulator n=1 Tax=Actinokineospora baliensis TaxID=547056 RepID=UPI00195EC7CE|nr:XRE family transcriptional regulator [Actinokineospora baliensis]MBM7773174.1 transcriptional regulator with XRE-family HTH domain [Actinokineospora baliensis]
MARSARLPELGRDLSRVPRGGSFAQVLDAAITARGLTLDRVRYHLAEQGVDVSVATLSYWRRDRRRPEREESLRAVRALEALLGLPATSLITLLGPPKPRGRWLRRQSEMPLSAEFDDPEEGEYTLVSAHDVFTVAEDHTERGTWTRLVVRGERGRVTRCLVKYQADNPDYPPALVDVRFCSRGRVRVDESGRLMVAELLLDRPLRVGEHAVVEYEFAAAPGPPVSFYWRQFLAPVAEYSQQIQFEGTEPARCTGFRQANPSAPEVAEPLAVGPSGAASQVGFNLAPGVFGTRWSW